MKALTRFHTIVLVLTTVIVCSLWVLFTKISIAKSSDTVSTSPDTTGTSSGAIAISFGAIAITSVTSIGFYRSVLAIVKVLTLKFRWIKKLVFGAEYLEGIWVGVYSGKTGIIRFYIETFEQDFESITIRADEYNENGEYYGSWISESVSFDAKKGILNYTYKADAMKNSFANSGIAEFTVKRKNNNVPPNRLFGFYADLYSSKKMKALEEKTDIGPDMKNIEEVLQKAKNLYDANKSFFAHDSEPQQEAEESAASNSALPAC